MQTNNDTHGQDPSFLSTSTWCREFGAAAPRQANSTKEVIQARSKKNNPVQTTLAEWESSSGKAIATPKLEQKVHTSHSSRWSPSAGPAMDLPIFALGKGTSAGPSARNSTSKDGGFNAPNYWCRF